MVATLLGNSLAIMLKLPVRKPELPMASMILENYHEFVNMQYLCILHFSWHYIYYYLFNQLWTGLAKIWSPISSFSSLLYFHFILSQF